MPLEVPNATTLLPLLPTTPPNVQALLSPVENIVHGYNMAEQTCFHKTTVSNVIPGFSRLSAFVKEIEALLQPVTDLISAATTLITNVISAVGLTRTMLSAATTVVGAVTTVITTVTTLVGTVITLVGTVIGALTTIVGLVTSIIATLGGLATACLVAGIATIAAGVLFGFGFVGLGGIALTVLLAIFFFVVRGAVMGIAAVLGLLTTALATITGALGTLTTALGTLTPVLGTLTGALGPLNTAIGAVNDILENPAAPPAPDVRQSLEDVSAALTNLQNALATGGQFTNTLTSTAATLDQRTAALRTFLAPATPKVPRASLQDAYNDAIAIYNAGVTAAAAQVPPAVWDVVRATAINAPQIEPNGILDTRLPCPKEFREG